MRFNSKSSSWALNEAYRFIAETYIQINVHKNKVI